MTNTPSDNREPETSEGRLLALRDRPVAARQGEMPGWPRTRGNVWMLEQASDGSLRYLSDCYGGRVIGYEDVEGVALAQTPPLALAIIAFGGNAGIERPLTERFEWHVVAVDHAGTLHGRGPADAARAQAVAVQRLTETTNGALRSIAAISAPQSSALMQDADPESPLVMDCLELLNATTKALVMRGKTVFADRMSLSLLDGAPDTAERAASDHYAKTAQMLAKKVTLITGQNSAPLSVVSQSIGGKVALAEGRLDIDHPNLGFVVATPRHPFPREPDHPAILTSRAQMLVDELEARAVVTVQNGDRWYCPRLRQAWRQGDEIIAEFSALSDLTFDGTPHGFGFSGCETEPKIIGMKVRGKFAIIEIDGQLEGKDVYLTYAWSPNGSVSGNLRDSWTEDSILAPGTTLYRYALSCRMRILPSDLTLPEESA